jgi:hypothetical protein
MMYPVEMVSCGMIYVPSSMTISLGIVMDLVNAFPGSSSVKTVQHATIEEAVFSVDSTDAPIDWLDSDHVICVYCRSMSIRSRQLRVTRADTSSSRGRSTRTSKQVSSRQEITTGSSQLKKNYKSACEDLTSD